uniref:Fibronectin type-III domain-containing protein n=1 Tax=Ascaris lumbricoides TaxID=6252 RepID=A0A0M3IRF0_ASCLU
FQYGGQEVVVVLSGESTDRFHSENENTLRSTSAMLLCADVERNKSISGYIGLVNEDMQNRTTEFVVVAVVERQLNEDYESVESVVSTVFASTNNSVTVTIGWSPTDKPPACSLHVECTSRASFWRKDFKPDMSMSIALSGLHFSNNYTVQIFAWPNSHRNSSILGMLRFSTESCRDLTDDLSLCALFEQYKGLLSLHSPQREYLSLQHMRSLAVDVSFSYCNYVAEVIVVDSNNRSSSSVFKRRLIPYSLPVDHRNAKVTLFLVSLLSLYVTAVVLFFVWRLMKGHFSRIRIDMRNSIRRAATIRSVPPHSVSVDSEDTSSYSSSGFERTHVMCTETVPQESLAFNGDDFSSYVQLITSSTSDEISSTETIIPVIPYLNYFFISE